MFAIDTKNVTDEKGVALLYESETLGKSQYDAFVENVLTTGRQSISEPLKRNKLKIFHHQSEKPSSREKLETLSMKSDISLFLSVYRLPES